MNHETSSPSAGSATTSQPMALRLSASSSVDFGPLVEQMEAGNMTPREISDAKNKVAAWLSRMRWMMGTLAAQRAKAVSKHRDNYKSMAETERAWEVTETGQQEIMLHHQIKALEGIFSALETNWFLLQGERKSNY